MSNFRVAIENIFDGISSTRYFGAKSSYDSSIGVDPDYPIEGQIKTSGMLCPTPYAKFSSITGAPMWIVTNPKESNVYVYTTDGSFVRYDEDLDNETSLTSPTSGAGNGMAYYNNYIYLATPTNISRYGPMNGTPTMAQNVWTSALLGTQTSLGNFTYPTIRGVKVPNHPMHVHGDNFLYFGDVVDGQGVIHAIGTQKGSVEGDTDDSSAYNVLDLPFGYIPTDIASYGTDLVILAMQTRDDKINQGGASLFFWDTFDDTFYNEVPLSDPMATAILNSNGRLYIWSGNSQNGCRLSEYLGGDSVREIAYLEEGAPPFAGAVDSLGSRLAWGVYTTYPEDSASIMAFGSKSSRLPAGMHNIIRATSSGANRNVTSAKFVQQSSNIRPRMVVGWNDDSGSGLDKYNSGATLNNIWRSKLYTIGNKFNIHKISMRLGREIAANMEVSVKIYIDDLSSSFTLSTVNNTNFSGRKVIYKRPGLDNVRGENNFLIELSWGGTAELPVTLPLTIYGEVFEDETAQ
jgi:hypothetical protein